MKKAILLLKTLTSATLFIALISCATIIGDPTYVMPINSNPSEASIIITDEKGVEVFKGQTPTTVSLQKSDGSYWGGKTYAVKISKNGYETQTIPVTSHPNGWYIAGNLIFGGLIGWFIVDPLNGDMYNLSPENINASMSVKTSHNNTATNGSISIMLIDDVPSELRSKMTRIHLPLPNNQKELKESE